MVEKTNTNNSTPNVEKSSNKKSDDGNWQQRKARHQKGDNYKKTTNQSALIGGTEDRQIHSHRNNHGKGLHK